MASVPSTAVATFKSLNILMVCLRFQGSGCSKTSSCWGGKLCPGFSGADCETRSYRGLRVKIGAAFFEECIDSRSEEHTSELQSIMRISYSVFCLTNNIN